VIVRQKIIQFNRNPNGSIEDCSQMDQNSQNDQEGQESEKMSDGIDHLGHVESLYESLFAVMGEYGNCIMIYSSDSVILKH
jgi:hypothetical protein